MIGPNYSIHSTTNSQGGHIKGFPLVGLTLVRYVLQNILVYWMHLFLLPMEVCHKNDEIMARFIWSGTEMKGKIHLVRWKAIARSTVEWGWGIQNTHNFNCALIIKSLWRASSEKGIWGKIIRDKYMKGQGLSTWSRMGERKINGA